MRRGQSGGGEEAAMSTLQGADRPGLLDSSSCGVGDIFHLLSNEEYVFHIQVMYECGK